jgi:hypothetical protein
MLCAPSVGLRDNGWCGSYLILQRTNTRGVVRFNHNIGKCQRLMALVGVDTHELTGFEMRLEYLVQSSLQINSRRQRKLPRCSDELIRFNSSKMLFHKARILDGDRFMETSVDQFINRVSSKDAI